MRLASFKVLTLGLLITALLPQAYAESTPLPALGADLSQTSVSGISSGGFMAAQLATAYSSRFIGVGIIAAGPFYCAGTYPSLSFLQNAVTTCMAPASRFAAADGAKSLENAKRFADQGLIDPVSNLSRQRAYIFSGSKDPTVAPIVVDASYNYYRLAVADPDKQILYSKDVAAGHSIVTGEQDDVPCGETRAPYINNCDFTQSQVLLAHIYGDASKPPSKAGPSGKIIRFNQRAFITGDLSSMDDEAYVYVPTYCQQNSCIVHIAFHGCQQGARYIGDHFYAGTGYNEYADTNKMIVLYPQAIRSRGIPANPKGCWDFWGYSDEDRQYPAFFSKKSPQMQAIIAMLDQLGKKP